MFLFAGQMFNDFYDRAKRKNELQQKARDIEEGPELSYRVYTGHQNDLAKKHSIHTGVFMVEVWQQEEVDKAATRCLCQRGVSQAVANTHTALTLQAGPQKGFLVNTLEIKHYKHKNPPVLQ